MSKKVQNTRKIIRKIITATKVAMHRGEVPPSMGWFIYTAKVIFKFVFTKLRPNHCYCARVPWHLAIFYILVRLSCHFLLNYLPCTVSKPVHKLYSKFLFSSAHFSDNLRKWVVWCSCRLRIWWCDRSNSPAEKITTYKSVNNFDTYHFTEFVVEPTIFDVERRVQSFCLPVQLWGVQIYQVFEKWVFQSGMKKLILNGNVMLTRVTISTYIQALTLQLFP